MTLYAIADLHLGHGVSKPMTVFGDQWERHAEQLQKNWEKVGPEDTVVIAGDISWAMTLDEALPDFEFLDRLPGKKIFLRGNHDYWWTSLKKLNQFCTENQFHSLHFLRNSGYSASDDWMICGTRGWLLPDDPLFGQADEKIYQREAYRLQLSLEAAQKNKKPGQRLLVAMHYPPFSAQLKETLFTQLIHQYQADCCVYGHIHGVPPEPKKQGFSGSIPCVLVAADHLRFNPWAVATQTDV